MERQRIEEILGQVNKAKQLAGRTDFVVEPDELEALLRLALAAMPVVEWEEVGDEWCAVFNRFINLGVWIGWPDNSKYVWGVCVDGEWPIEGTADSLESAKAAAEAVLWCWTQE